MASSQNPENSLRVETEASEDTPQDQAVNLETNSTANTSQISGTSQTGLGNGPPSPGDGIVFVRTIVHERSITIRLEFVPIECLYPARPTYHIPPAIQRTYSLADRLRLFSRLQAQALRTRRISLTRENFEGEDLTRPAGQTATNMQEPEVQQSPNGNNLAE